MDNFKSAVGPIYHDHSEPGGAERPWQALTRTPARRAIGHVANSSAPGEIIILVGTSCAGKTTIAQAIQRIADRSYLSTGNDDFLPMFPLKFVGLDKSIQPAILVWPEPGSPRTRDGYEVIVAEPGDPPKFHLFCGPAAWRSLQGMHAACAALARAGTPVVIADVVTEPLLINYCTALAGLDVYLVLVDCPLDELERRERAHRNRTPGGARMQYEAVRTPGVFDLTIDSGANDAVTCARQVLDFVASHRPLAFPRLAARYAGRPPPGFPVQIW